MNRPPNDTTTRDGRSNRWAMRDIVLVVVFAVVFGFLYWVLVQGWLWLSVATGPFGDLTQHVLLGGWLLAAPLAVAITRRPFAGVLAEILASVIEVVFLGSAVGPILLVAAALQGIGSELPRSAPRWCSSSPRSVSAGTAPTCSSRDSGCNWCPV
jgi:energy-coupling factor transport system substrate-specific component